LKLAGTLVELERFTDAVEAYRHILVLAPDRPAAREGLESLLDSSAGDRAAMGLEPVYRALGDWSKLVAVYERLAAASADPVERVERLLAIKSIYEERLGRFDHAFHAAARALKDAPMSEDVLSALERLAAAARIQDELTALYEDQAEALTPKSPERVALRTRLARHLEEQRADRKTILIAWRKVLEERPGDPTALEAIVRTSTDLGDFDQAVAGLESLAEVLEDPKAKIEKLKSAARIVELQAGEPQRIIRCYERVLAIHSGSTPASPRP
jgi:tetratricopeptide (TPR) repeat protein